MPFTITMPKLSPTMESGVIAKWLIKPGDKVEAGSVIVEISTDKATVEHTALDEGYLRKILIEEGKEAPVNAPMAIFSETADEPFEEAIQTIEPIKEAPKAASVAVAAPKIEPQISGERLIASPLAKKLAKEKGIDLHTVSGSGPRGRILAKDLETKAKAPALGEQEIPLTPIRRVIAERLQEAKSSIPHFYIEQTVDAENLVAFREQLHALDKKVSFNDIIIKAVALSLKAHPEINRGFHAKNRSILQFSSIDISVAVSLESGLITPIVPHADKKSIEEISLEIKALAQRAKEGKLAPHEFQGGSFTVSNLGMFGVTRFTAIINPPQAAILAIGGILDAPVIKNGALAAGSALNLTLSVDHRVIDGVAGAKFIKTLQRFLENPAALS